MTPCTRWGHAQEPGRGGEGRVMEATTESLVSLVPLIFPAPFGGLLYPAPRLVLDFLGGV